MVQAVTVVNSCDAPSDDAENIQAAILGKNPVFLSAGDYEIGKTIETPFRVGGTLRGAGSGAYTKPLHTHRGVITVLNATGENGDEPNPLIKYCGTHFVLSDLTLRGALIGLWVTRPRDGIGAGKHNFSRLAMQDLSIAFQIAEQASDNNCDTSRWSDIMIHQCEIGWRSVGHQAMQHRIEHVQLRQVDTFLDIRGGGGWYADDVVMTKALTRGKSPVLLRIRQTRFGDRGRAAIGRANGDFEIRNLKTDAQAGSVTLLEHVNDCPITARFLGGRCVEPPAANIRSNSSLTIRDFAYLGDRGLSWDGQRGRRVPNITVRDCQVRDITSPHQLFDFKACGGDCWVTVQNCYVYPSGKPLGDLVGLVRSNPGNDTWQLIDI